MAEIEKVIYKLEADIGQLNSQLAAVKRQVDTTGQQFGTLGRTFQAQERSIVASANSIKVAIAGAFGTAIGLGISSLVKGVFEANAQFQATINVLRTVTGSTESAKKEFDEVAQIAQRLGLDLKSTTQQFAQLAAAAKGTKLEGAGVKELFKGIADVSGALDLSAEKTSGVILAFQQIISKGKLSTEELLQIAERVPGTFGRFATALGVTQEKLADLLQKGLLPATEVIPKVAKQLQDEFGAAALASSNSAESAINNLNTAIFNLQRSLGDAGVFDAFIRAINTLATGVQIATEKLTAFDEAVRNRIAQGNTVNDQLTQNAAKFDELSESLEQLKAELQSTPSGTTLFTQIQQQIADTEAQLKGLSERIPQQADAILQGRFERTGLRPGEGTARVDPAVQRANEQAAQFNAAATAADNAAAATARLTKSTVTLTDAQREAIALGKQRTDALQDLQQENQQLQALAAAYGKSDESAVRLANSTVKIDQVLSSLQLGGSSGGLTKQFKDALEQNEKLQRSIEVSKKFLEFKQAQEETQRLIDAFKSGGEEGLRLAEAANEVNRAIEELNIDPASALAEQLRQAGANATAATEELRKLQEAKQKLKEADDRAQKQAQDALEDFYDKQEKATDDAAQKQADLFAEPFKNALADIQSTFTDTFENILRGGVTSFQDLADAAKDIFFRLAANLASTALFNPSSIFGGGTGAAPGTPSVFGGGGLSSLFAPGQTIGGAFPSLNGTLAGGASVSGTLGAAGLGFAGGSLVGQAFGQSGTGTGIGGGLGAGLGFALTGGSPLGGLIGGGLGTLAGGLIENFFGSSPQDNNAQFQFNVGSGQRSSVVGKNADPNNQSVTERIGQELQNLRTALAQTGAEFADLNVEVKAGTESGFRLRTPGAAGGDNAQSFDNADQLAAAALRAIVESATSGITDQQRDILNRSGANTAQGLLADLKVPDQLAAAINGPDSGLKQAIDTITASFKELSDNAKRLGLDTTGLASARTREIEAVKEQARATLGLGDPLETAIEAIRQQFKAAREDADLLGVSLADLNAAEADRIASVKAQAEISRQQQLTSLGVINQGPLAQAIAQIRFAFAQARLQADTLHVSVERLNEVEADRIATVTAEIRQSQRIANIQKTQQNTNERIALGIAKFSDPLQEAIFRIRQEAALAVPRLKELGITQAQLTRATNERITAARNEAQQQLQAQVQAANQNAVGAVQGAVSGFNSLIDPLSAFRTSLAVNDNGQGTASSRLQSAQDLFNQAVASTGDGASQSEINDVISLGQQVIDLSRQVNASGPEFQRQFQFVNQTIGDLQKSLEQERDNFIKSLPAEFRAQADREVAELQQLKQVAKDQIAEFQSLSRDLRDFIRRRAS